jgi:hypothetical protein
LPFTPNEWIEARNCGYHVHFNTKKGGYAPYSPNSYTEYSHSHVPDSATTPPPNRPTAEKSNINEPSTVEETRPKEIPKKHVPVKEESKYYITNAGRFLLDMTVDDLLKARELLRRFEQGNSLGNNELEYLLKNDLLNEKIV